MEAGPEWNVLLEAINALGVIGLLTFMVFAFYRGDLVARNLLDRILALYEDQLSELTEKILDRLDHLVSKQN